MKFDHIFNSYDYEDNDTLTMATIEFEGYTINWWNQITLNMARGRRLHINSWVQLYEGNMCTSLL